MQTNAQLQPVAKPFLGEDNVIFTDKAPLPLGTYSQGIKVSHGQTIYLSAQTPVSALSNEVLAKDFEGQLRQTLDNLQQTTGAIADQRGDIKVVMQQLLQVSKQAGAALEQTTTL
ncbi:Rid family hydrolase, partial [Pantoea sp. SIMBA_072]